MKSEPKSIQEIHRAKKDPGIRVECEQGTFVPEAHI
jgi:hypothetical protein